tara:strand:+ start:13864 stop:14553 length:690 start_codon:yes stop_codon:yes gene_type:complete
VLVRVVGEDRVRVHGDPVADQLQQGDVVAAVGVRPAVGDIRSRLRCERARRRGLALGVEHVTDQFPGVDAVDGLHLGAERAGESQLAGDQVADLPGCRRDEPDLVAFAQVVAGELDRLGVEPRLDPTLPDALAESDDLLASVAGGEPEGALTGRDEVQVVLADRDESGLMPDEAPDVAPAHESACHGFAADLEDARAAHERVVDIEERDDRAIARAEVGGGHRRNSSRR